MPKLVSAVSASGERNSLEVLQLIADYQRSARAVVTELQRQYREKDLIAAWRQGRIKRAGTLKRPAGRYSFHGVGCRFEVGKRLIDVDFGPGGRYDGFDAWRLALFASSAFEWQHLLKANIEAGLRELERTQTIRYLDDTSHLYYLAEGLETKRPPSPRRISA